MTIISNWCQDCQEECAAHSRMCLTCGGTLTTRPTTNNNNTRTAGTNSSNTTTTNTTNVSFRAMPDIEAFLPAQFSAADATTDLLANLRRQVRDTTTLAQQAIIDNGQNNTNNPDGDWQAIPAELLNPQNNESSHKRPTSAEVLQKLPRETLTIKSPSLYHVSIDIIASKDADEQVVWRLDDAVTGELGPLPSMTLNDDKKKNGPEQEHHQIHVEAPLWIPSSRFQRTGKDPLKDIPESPSMFVLERGDGISFFQKSLQAQTAGAVAVIIMNDKTQPWPYCMKDSRSTVQKQQQSIDIPVVMIPQATGQRLIKEYNNNNKAQLSQYHARLTIGYNNDDSGQQQQRSSPSCIICREALSLGETVLTLTNFCGHAFHESCALQWLQHHNTCPYCRRSLPTDNAEEEQERRRQMTTFAASGGQQQQGEGGDAFYG